MKAKIAYLTSPAPNTFVLNIQCEGTEGIQRFEISKAHLTNILIDGTSWALREGLHRNEFKAPVEPINRVPNNNEPENAEHERAG